MCLYVFYSGEKYGGGGRVCVCYPCMHLPLAMSNSDGQIDYEVKLEILFFAAQASIDFCMFGCVYGSTDAF